MMDKIKDFFDDFTFHARVMPALVIIIPILVIGIYNGSIFSSWTENTTLVLIALVFLTFTSKIARNEGKRYEKLMYKQLGGMPTTIVLRFSDNTFDNVTKQRYHKRINKYSELNLPLDAKDENPNSDDQYQSAANFLRNYANSNRDKEFRVYQELKEYNFWRNLYGTKRIGLFIYLVIAVREIVIIDNFNIKQVFLQPYPKYLVLIIMLLCILALIFFATKKTVEQKAFDYAKTLIEVCERYKG